MEAVCQALSAASFWPQSPVRGAGWAVGRIQPAMAKPARLLSKRAGPPT